MDPVIGALLTLIGVVFSAVLTKRGSDRKLRQDAGQQMIDQHQEDIATLRKEVSDLRRTQRIQGDYIGQLRRHIADGNPPPPPAWPEGLIT
ncbi:hypothetical protein [Actinoplanes siamensis]|uniref:Uncharacterized protein n=1 Tax=Actinoplanes siamensis TaxID=1223317 RepID=A0A919ND22_9ACTN|nr:hypothetical protein [Actinoplanes siamensis]GIF08641.1 hypothetical protein Asi03nite_61790 [Actinoplanes siamensis]